MPEEPPQDGETPPPGTDIDIDIDTGNGAAPKTPEEPAISPIGWVLIGTGAFVMVAAVVSAV